MANRNMKADMNVQFTEASSRQSIESGESVKTLFGKIRKWLSDLKPVAFSGSYNDLSNKPTTGVSGVKGNSETSYRTGNVNLTPANIGLGNVNNTSDANKPISTAAQAALDKQQAQVNAALKQTGYNLFEITADTQTIDGVTFTVDKEAGTITANGTANQLILFRFKLQINDGEYIVSGCPPTGSDSTYRIDIRDQTGTTLVENSADFGMGTAAITLSSDKYLFIRIAKGYNCNNLVFKPMIVPAELAGVPFQPYAKSNAELTSGKLDVTGNSDTPYDDLPDHFELTAHHGNTLFIKMIPYASSNITYLLLGNDDTLQYFGIERDCFVVQTKDANSTYEFRDDGIYLNGTRIAP